MFSFSYVFHAFWPQRSRNITHVMVWRKHQILRKSEILPNLTEALPEHFLWALMSSSREELARRLILSLRRAAQLLMIRLSSTRPFKPMPCPGSFTRISSRTSHTSERWRPQELLARAHELTPSTRIRQEAADRFCLIYPLSIIHNVLLSLSSKSKKHWTRKQNCYFSLVSQE